VAAAAVGTTVPTANRLVLSGDDADFDNTVYVVPPVPDVARVLYAGLDAADDVNGLRYYLQGALAAAPGRRVEFAARPPTEPVTDADLLDLRLAVVAAALPDAAVDRLRRYADAGGTVLWVLRDAAAAGGLARLAGVPDLGVAEAPATGFALVGRVDLAHPLFAAFADARFADFTKVHFWKHRRLTLPADPAAVRVLAWFDDGDPYLLERPVARGRVIVAASGWQPADSQLALSTKFVPLLDGLVRRRDGLGVGAQQVVYEPIPLPPAAAGGPSSGPPSPGGSAFVGSSAASRALLTPDGRRIDLPNELTTAPATAADRPGIYRIVAGGRETPVAVNLPLDESRTAAMPVEDLERFGAKLGTAETAEQLAARQRQLRQAELESRQKLWRWVILGVLGLLAAETLVAGRLARRRVADAPVPSAA
ncbi:MAG: hypothetical protein JWO31_690, partial [Phycisphaerales bacterium]|nr:hypothetical protein [Phycisphaerales bacterium]